jgi:hypothetical protein
MPDCSSVYGFLRDQGSIIAGLFALIAGGIAYLVAVMQIDALKRKEQRQRASTGLSANRLLDGVLAIVDNDLTREIDFVGNGIPISDTISAQGGAITALLAQLTRQRVKVPDLALIWPQLGLQQTEWINNFLALHRAISNAHQIDPRQPQIAMNRLLDEYRTRLAVVGELRQELEKAARSLNDILAA